MERLLLVRYGEIGLKGRNRHVFEEKLADNMRAALADIEGAKVNREYGRIFVRLEDEGRTGEALERLQRVFGIVAVNPALRVPLDLEAIREAAAMLVRGGRRSAPHVPRQRGGVRTSGFRTPPRSSTIWWAPTCCGTCPISRYS